MHAVDETFTALVIVTPLLSRVHVTSELSPWGPAPNTPACLQLRPSLVQSATRSLEVLVGAQPKGKYVSEHI